MKTTKQDYKYFVEKLDYWQKALGLSDWHIYVEHSKSKDMANVYYNTYSRKATVVLGLDWKEMKVTQSELDRSALHEMTHLLLADLCDLADKYTREAIEEKEHIIINRLYKLLNLTKP